MKSIVKTKISKGDFGYIDNHKMRQLIFTFISLVMVAVIFYTGVIRYHNTKNIFTVIAAVASIPTAKIAVSYIVMLKKKSIDKETYDKIKNSVEDTLIIYELLITSTEKIISIEAAAIKDNSVFCLKLTDNDDDKYASTYIKEFLETENKVSTVRIFKSVEAFVKAISALDKNESGKFDENIKKLMLIYSM